MRQLLAQHVDNASTRRTAPMIAEAPSRERACTAGQSGGESRVTRSLECRTRARCPAETARRPALRPGSAAACRYVDAVGAAGTRARRDRAEPIRPVAVRTVCGEATARVDSASARGRRAPQPAGGHVPAAGRAETPPPAPVARRRPPAACCRQHALPSRQRSRRQRAGAGRRPCARPRPPRETAPAPAVPSARPQTRSGWIIQVGAYPAESEAQQRLALVKSKASRLLAAAEPVHRAGATGRNHPLSGPFRRARHANRRRPPANSSSVTTSIAWQSRN